MNDGQQDVCICPSFNSYSSDGVAETAVRVAGDASQHGGDDDFEFALDAAEEIFYDGQIGPVFPVFNRDLLKNDAQSSSIDDNDPPESESNVVISLNQLFVEEDNNNERDCNPPSCSSSEADELENIPVGTYCVWRPRTAEPPPLLPSQCKKSKSTGSGSKRWKLLDLSRRSKSDGKESFVFLTPKHREEKPEKLIQASRNTGGGAPPSAHAAFYVRNRAMKEEDKKKSYLPYRQDLVGFFANVNGMRRTFPHF